MQINISTLLPYAFLQHGTCVWPEETSQGFVVVGCTCEDGWAGDFCADDEDGCASGPCFSGVQCTDVAVANLADHPSGFTCEVCPPGMKGDGQSCVGECRAK